MTRVWRPINEVLAGLFVAATCAFSQSTISARPGTINYVEGRAFVDGRELDQKQMGHVTLDVGQTLSTDQNSKAELLLTPGVFLRLGQGSEVKMITPSLTNTRVQLTRGEALIDIAELFKENNVEILNNKASTRLEKPGLYRFKVDNPQVEVIDGKASVTNGDSRVELKKGREVAITSGQLHAAKFDTKKEDDLYAWSNLRSEYAAEASYATAKNMVVNDYGGWGPGWDGWLWNPWYSSWAFVPGGGYFYDPFGWGFFSPRFVYRAPVYVAPWRHRPVPVNPARPPVVAHLHSGAFGPGMVARPQAVRSMRPGGMMGPHFSGASHGFGGGGGRR